MLCLCRLSFGSGIPLPGEAHKPRSVFEDIGKEYLAPPLPEMPKDYKEHPERDLVNFPYPARPQYPIKTRMLMLPDSWFNAFYKVTGTSGNFTSLMSCHAYIRSVFVLWWCLCILCEQGIVGP